MAAVGITHEQIAKVLGISSDTLVKRLKEELATARTKANASVAGKLYEKAMRGDTACMIFWLKCRAGWRENEPVDITQGDVSVNITYVSSPEPTEEDTPPQFREIVSKVDSGLH